MKKSEAEPIIRRLIHDWANKNGVAVGSAEQPDFGAFYSWLIDKYWGYTQFRSSISACYDIEFWFDDELKQSWRN